MYFSSLFADAENKNVLPFIDTKEIQYFAKPPVSRGYGLDFHGRVNWKTLHFVDRNDAEKLRVVFCSEFQGEKESFEIFVPKL